MKSKQLVARCLRPKQLALLLTCVMICHGVAIGKGYDYFGNVRYPAVLRDDVSRDTIKQGGVVWRPGCAGTGTQVRDGVPEKGQQ